MQGIHSFGNKRRKETKKELNKNSGRLTMHVAHLLVLLGIIPTYNYEIATKRMQELVYALIKGSDRGTMAHDESVSLIRFYIYSR